MILYVVVISIIPAWIKTKRFYVLPIECISVIIKDLRRNIFSLNNAHCFFFLTKTEYISCVVRPGLLNIFQVTLVL
jgi:hypothetical protein